MHVLLHTFVWGWPGSSVENPSRDYFKNNNHQVADRERDIGFYLNVPRFFFYFFNGYEEGFVGYLWCCCKKVRLLMKMTVGIWDLELVRNFEVVALARKYDDDIGDADTNHQEVISCLGKGHSLLWQFFPLGK